MGQRLVTYWVYGGVLVGVLLLFLTPVFTRGWTPALLATYLMLPIYMLHQYEEHDADRFRAYINHVIGGGQEALTRLDVWVINVPGVWGVIGVALALAVFRDVGFGLIAVYLVLVNAVAHVVAWMATRDYNPGLGTAAGLFLPIGGWALWEILRAGGGTMGMQMLGFGVALAIHAAIVVYVKLRLRGLPKGRRH